MREITKKKNEKLGMNASTASNRLVKDLLFNFIISSGHKCFWCGEELTRETFSIEHKIPWLNSEDPKSLFFDIDNISYSHFLCNVKAAKRGIGPCEDYVYPKKGCKCEICRQKRRDRYVYCPTTRAEQYRRTKT